MTGFVKVDSWHIEVENDQTHTLCGLTVRTQADPLAEPPEHQIEGRSLTLPMTEKSCETCLRIMANA